MKVVVSPLSDGWSNLASEEVLLTRVAASGPILFFYVNDPVVVIGKNQNPWRECDTAYLRDQGIPLARRISGGGAVYHDPGNLNYSVLLPRTTYRQEVIFGAVLGALSDLGLPAELQGRTNVYTHGRKVSGSAFCFRGDVAMHHGTFLLQSDLTKLNRALRPPGLHLTGSGIASRPAVTLNLVDLAPHLTRERLIAALTDSIADRLGEKAEPWNEGQGPADERARSARRAEHASWAWQFGITPAFRAELMLSGGQPLICEVENGCIARASAGDAVLSAIHGLRFSKPLIEKHLSVSLNPATPDF